MTNHRYTDVGVWMRRLDGEQLTDSDLDGLRTAMETDANLRRELLDDDRWDGLLSASLRAESDGVAFATKIRTVLGADQGGARFAARVGKVIRQTDRNRTRRSLRWWVTSAAIPVLATCIWVVIRLPGAYNHRLHSPAQSTPAAASPNSETPSLQGTVPTAWIQVHQGEAHRLALARRIQVQDGGLLHQGEGLLTSGRSAAGLSFSDGTTIELDPSTTIAAVSDVGNVRRILLTSGVIRARVVRQRADHSLVFTTPHAEVVVLGTELVLSASDVTGTDLHVIEGRVRLIASSGRSIEVSTGEAAQVTAAALRIETGKVIGRALLIAGTIPLGPGDAAIKARLDGLGFAVDVRSQLAAAVAIPRGTSIVMLSSSVSSVFVGSTLRDISVPLIVWDNWLYDDLGLTGGVESVDYGTLVGSTRIDVLASPHPLAISRSGVVRVSNVPFRMAWGLPSDEAVLIALTAAGDPRRPAVFAYDRGAKMVGLFAPARRIAMFLNDDTAASLTAQGWDLFDAAVRWAAEDAPSP